MSKQNTSTLTLLSETTCLFEWIYILYSNFQSKKEKRKQALFVNINLNAEAKVTVQANVEVADEIGEKEIAVF